MPSFTSDVSTVPGTVAAYQPSVLKSCPDTSEPACITFATSCNCHPADITKRSCGPVAAAGFADRVPCAAGFAAVACVGGFAAGVARAAGFAGVTCAAP